MIELLQRSVAPGHKKLALMRCLQAEQMGMEIRPGLLAYYWLAAATMSVPELQRLAARAVQPGVPVERMPSGTLAGIQ